MKLISCEMCHGRATERDHCGGRQRNNVSNLIQKRSDTSENARTTEDVLQVLKNFSRSQSPSM